MDSDKLHLEIDRVSTCGVILSTEEKSCLQSSIVTLKSKQKFQRVIFWGKIFGVQSNYYIVQGLGQDEMSDRKSLYSINGLEWSTLPTVNNQMREKAQQVRGRFTGDPSYEMEYKIERRQYPSGEEEGDSDGHVDVEEIVLKEEERLAAVIAMIDEDTLVVPRGAYVRRATGSTMKNRTWEGLNPSDAILAKNYVHFRKAKAEREEEIVIDSLQRRRPVPGLDFLESIEQDVPRGSWTCQLHRGSTVIMRSLLWTGYFFYHIPNTCEFGSIYFGYGEKNLDLPFML